MKLISLGLSLLALAALLGAQAASDAPVPVSAEPHHHLVLDKPMVRVYEFFLGPRQPRRWADCVYQGAVDPRGEKPGGYRRAQCRDRNPGHRAATHRRAEPETYSEAPGVTTKLLFENDLVRAWDTQIDPGATQPRHEHHLDYLAIAVSPLDMKSLTDFKAFADIRKKPGEVTWVRAPVAHSITNMADTSARFISMEFKQGGFRPCQEGVPRRPAAYDLSRAASIFANGEALPEVLR